MTYKHNPSPYDWEGQLTGRDPILGRGRARHGHRWWFRADSTGWAFQTWGRSSDLVGTRGGDVLGPPGSTTDEIHKAAWTVVEDCLRARGADELPPIGSHAVAPAWSRANAAITDDQPLLPGQIQGDLTAQPAGDHYPIHRYADDARTCRQCGARFVFTAAEQQHGYEVLKIIESAHPGDCRRCRRERKAANALANTLSAASTTAADAPADARARLALAEAILALRADRAEGDIEHAVHAARRARSLDPSLTAAAEEVLTRARTALPTPPPPAA